ncbi:hypothetical protein FQN54_002803 [Arachnomyces sp. PD_36]|nr:hypothetical protein FQN54_002803 [Arachnomyces sp. PD_36]
MEKGSLLPVYETPGGDGSPPSYGSLALDSSLSRSTSKKEPYAAARHESKLSGNESGTEGKLASFGNFFGKWHKSAKSAKPGKPGKPEDEEEEVPVETYRKRIKDLDKKLADKEHAHQAALKDHQAALKDQQLSHQKLLDSYEKLRGDYTQLVANHLKHSEKLTEQHILNNQKLTEQHFLNNQKLIDLLVNEKRRAEHACFKARTEREAAVARAEKAEERIRHLERQIEKQNESESVEKIGERS